MQRLIDDLLSYSRAGGAPLELESVDTAEIANEVVQSLSAEIEAANAEVTVGELPNVRADRTQLIQIFQNLLETRSSSPATGRLSSRSPPADPTSTGVSK